METATAPETSDLVVDVRHVTTTTTTAIPTHTNTVVPAVFETTTTPEQLNHPADAQHIAIPPAPNQVETEAEPATTE